MLKELIYNILENCEEYICIFDKNGKIIYSNNKFKLDFNISNIFEIISKQKKVFSNSYENIFFIKEQPFFIKIVSYDEFFFTIIFHFSFYKDLIYEYDILRKIIEEVPTIIILFDSNFEISFVNNQFFNYFNINKEKKLNLKEIFLNEIEFLNLLSDNINNRKNSSGKIILSINNEKLIFNYNLIIIKSYLNNPKFCLILKDIAFEEKVALEMTKISKFDSLKVITDGVSHDLNNLLVSLVGNISLAKHLIKPTSKAYSFIEEAEKACSRAKDLSLKLLSISRGLPMMKKQVEINKILKETTIFVLNGKFFNLNINLSFEFEKEEFKISVDEGQLIQVIENIVTNACQAMPEGGNLTIGTKEVDIIESKNYFPIKSGKYLCIYIKDSGKGISPLIISKIFDPYFTTRKDGNGLGLSISYSIIRNHKGYIDVISQIGVGSTFYIYLPFE